MSRYLHQAYNITGEMKHDDRNEINDDPGKDDSHRRTGCFW